MNYSYSEIKKDFMFLSYLDFGGDFQGIEARVFELMGCPTKTLAKELYLEAISLWFYSLYRGGADETSVEKEHLKNQKVIAIAEKYGHLKDL